MKTKEQLREEFRREIRERGWLRPARPKAPVVKLPVRMNEPPAQLSDAELWRRQQLIDAAWERTLEARREMEEAYSRTCHRGPGDPDWR